MLYNKQHRRMIYLDSATRAGGGRKGDQRWGSLARENPKTTLGSINIISHCLRFDKNRNVVPELA